MNTHTVYIQYCLPTETVGPCCVVLTMIASRENQHSAVVSKFTAIMPITTFSRQHNNTTKCRYHRCNSAIPYTEKVLLVTTLLLLSSLLNHANAYSFAQQKQQQLAMKYDPPIVTSRNPHKLANGKGTFLGFRNAKEVPGLKQSPQPLMPDGGLSPCVIRVLGVGGGGCNAVRTCHSCMHACIDCRARKNQTFHEVAHSYTGPHT